MAASRVGCTVMVREPPVSPPWRRPVNGWKAFAQVAGNSNYYSIEHADKANPDNPLTDAQLTASAQVVEALAVHGRFPLQEANHVGEEGYGVHFMGGQGWGGHTCLDLPPRRVRSQQRAEILRRALAIRHGGHPVVPETPSTVVTDGSMPLAALAARHGTAPATVLRATAAPNGEYVHARRRTARASSARASSTTSTACSPAARRCCRPA
jgi:hypothetical protein